MAGCIGLGVATAQAADPAPVPPPPDRWEGSASLGLTLTKGNTESVLISTDAETHRLWPQDEWKFGAGVTYGNVTKEKSGKKTTEVSADNAKLFGQYNHLFTERFYAGARLDAYHDGVADLTYRLSLGPVAGYYFIKSPVTRLSAEVGPAFTIEKFYGKDNQKYLALRLSERFDHKVNDRLKVWEQFDLFPQVDELENYLARLELGMQVDLTKRLAMKTVFEDRYDNRPAPHTGKNDMTLIASIVYKW